MRNMETRIAKLEHFVSAKEDFPQFIQTFSDKCGKSGETIRRETNEEAIARHLTLHPEDKGKKFDFINIVLVHGQWGNSGEFICNDEKCQHFGTVRHRGAV